MITLHRRAFALAVAIGIVPVLGACAQDAEVEEEVDAPATSEIGTDEGLRVTEVDLGRSIGADGRVNDDDDTDEFGPNDTIYASVDTEGTARGTLTARWTYEDGQVVDESSQTLSPTGASVTEFHISKPDGLPAGEYKLEILLDGRVIETKDFEVQ